MLITSLKLQNFRCFPEKTFTFSDPLVVIEGPNGSGKTSVLEALHYACFLKSFRTNRIKELVALPQEHFYLDIGFDGNDVERNRIQIGFSQEVGPAKRIVRLNNKIIKSYRDLISHYRIISLTEDDMFLVQGGPEVRRTFLNEALTLFKPDMITTFRAYRKVLDQRNNILFTNQRLTGVVKDEFAIWSKQLWEQSRIIVDERIAYLHDLEKMVNILIEKHFAKLSLTITFDYLPKNIDLSKTFDQFWPKYSDKKVASELQMRRSLFGAHLDDFEITFRDKRARVFASRGQQKLIVFLIKVAQLSQLQAQGIEAIFLFDDFLTDFDQDRFSDCFEVLTHLPTQVFVSCPLRSFMQERLKKHKLQMIHL